MLQAKSLAEGKLENFIHEHNKKNAERQSSKENVG